VWTSGMNREGGRGKRVHVVFRGFTFRQNV
jgi:hypothetical protein